MNAMRITLTVLMLAFAATGLYGNGIAGPDKISENKRLSMIREMISDKLYSAAEKEITEMLETVTPESGIMECELETMLLKCRIELGRQDIDGLVYSYMTKYPQSKDQEELLLMQASYYFNRKEYEKAGNILGSINAAELAKDCMQEYLFKSAYCKMRGGNTEDALEDFNGVIRMKYSEYYAPSIYYAAYIHYINKRFNDAIPLLERITGNASYGHMARYYLLEAHFMLNDFDYVILNGRALYEESDREYKLKIARLLSEAYFKKDMPKEAKMFFEIYSTSGVNLSRKDTYYAGIISYSLQSYLGALESFKKTAGEKDTIGQSSYLYMGNCYIKLKNKVSAMNAYRNAAMMDFDGATKENAYYNYAKLAFDLNSDIQPFNNYLQLYPSSGKSDEIYNYIATSYLLQKKYAAAIDALEKISSSSEKTTRNLQKAAFFNGIELAEKGSYRKAAENFELAIKNGNYNRSLSDLSKYWLAEMMYKDENYTRSIELLTELTSDQGFMKSNESTGALYNLGYAYIKSENYPMAEKYFRQYLELPPSKRKNTLDAKIRLADSYFMQRKYDNAAETYEEASKFLNNNLEVYPMYQGALAYGLISNSRKKISMLRDIMENYQGSALYEQSVFELGRTYTQSGGYDNAINCFNTLLEAPDSSWYAKAMLELGMAYYNKSESNKALKYYKEIVKDYPNSQEAGNALAGIENIYQQNNSIEEYFAYLDEMGLSATKSEAEKETMLFNSAEQLFLSGNYGRAEKSFKSFLQKYPQGSRTAQANFYIAESLKNSGKLESASDYYMIVMQTGEGSFPEISTLNYAEISYQLNKFETALNAYESLLQIAKLENNRKEAELGIIRSLYKLGNYDKTIEAVTSTIDKQWVTMQIRSDLEYYLAKSLYAKGERDKAKIHFTQLAQNALTPEGAESNYILIQDAYESGDFLSVENRTFAFAETKTDQTYWLAKSFIVLGDSYAERDEWKQAEATFNSILEGYVPQNNNDDIIDQVKIRLEAIRKHPSYGQNNMLNTNNNQAL